jgi:hypothetical protein
MEYNITRPWLTLDEWQTEYIFRTPADQNCFLLTGRQVGKTAAMAIKAVELCIHDYKEGENILICSITEKQAYRMLAKALAYAETKYPKTICRDKDRKPTMHRLLFKNGSGIWCFAAGETGEGLRGDTIKKLMIDEGSRMSEEFFISVEPMLSVTHGSMDIASTPFGKKHKDGSLKYFYKCSLDEKYKKFYASAEDCPRHEKEFLEIQKNKMSRLAYAQEYLAIFTDELRRLFDDELIDKICVLKRDERFIRNEKSRYYIGVDVGGFGKDESTFEIFEKSQDMILQKENLVEKKNLTTETSKRILELNKIFKFRKIGVDDQGIGFGVLSELLDADETKRKVEALNNSTRLLKYDGERSKKLLKEEMYINLMMLMQNEKIKLLDDAEIKASLSSVQEDEGRIYASYGHIAEGINRGAWLASQDKSLNCFIRTF